jgi:hypothetical protein
MDEELFDKLITSVRQAGQFRRGEINPGRLFEYAAVDMRVTERDPKAEAEAPGANRLQ